MENAERVMLEEASRKNPEIRRLSRRHADIDKRLRAYSGRSYLTPEEEVEEKRLKFVKARAKERMFELLREFTV